MKYKATKTVIPPTFTPVVLEIEIQSQNELDAFGALFNCGPVVEAMREMGADNEIWKSLQEVGAAMDTSRFRALLKAKAHLL